MTDDLISDLLNHEHRLLELRRATRDLELRRRTLQSENEMLDREIRDRMAESGGDTDRQGPQDPKNHEAK